MEQGKFCIGKWTAVSWHLNSYLIWSCVCFPSAENSSIFFLKCISLLSRKSWSCHLSLWSDLYVVYMTIPQNRGINLMNHNIYMRVVLYDLDFVACLSDWLVVSLSIRLSDGQIYLSTWLADCLSDRFSDLLTVRLIGCLSDGVSVTVWPSECLMALTAAESFQTLSCSLSALLASYFLCLRLLTINRLRLFYFLGKVEVVFVVLTKVDSLEVRIVEFKNGPM